LEIEVEIPAVESLVKVEEADVSIDSSEANWEDGADV
jgi:hypothetical protein